MVILPLLSGSLQRKKSTSKGRLPSNSYIYNIRHSVCDLWHIRDSTCIYHYAHTHIRTHTHSLWYTLWVFCIRHRQPSVESLAPYTSRWCRGRRTHFIGRRLSLPKQHPHTQYMTLACSSWRTINSYKHIDTGIVTNTLTGLCFLNMISLHDISTHCQLTLTWCILHHCERCSHSLSLRFIHLWRYSVICIEYI